MPKTMRAIEIIGANSMKMKNNIMIFIVEQLLE